MDYKNFCRVSSLFLVKKKKRNIYVCIPNVNNSLYGRIIVLQLIFKIFASLFLLFL